MKESFSIWLFLLIDDAVRHAAPACRPRSRAINRPRAGNHACVVAFLFSLIFSFTIGSAATVVGVETYGATYGELSARWWQWLLSIPAAVNSNLDTTGTNCAQGQYDDVWFLAGSFGGTVERDCSIPAGKPIFFPLINTITFKPYGYETLLDLRSQAAAFIDTVNHLECSIDNGPVVPPGFRVRSPSFTVIAPSKGLLPSGKLTVPGNTDPIVSDGYWLLLEPLSPGDHTIYFKATTTGGFSLEVTYNLTIQ